MKKIPTIFVRDPNNLKALLDKPHHDCGWVFRGEGVATRKYDGTCCRVKGGVLWKRREIKKGGTLPAGFEIADHDTVTGKTVGWVEVGDAPEDRWHREAFVGAELDDGTYELLGPKIQGNLEHLSCHHLIGHNIAQILNDVPRTYEGLKDWLEGRDIEGLVFRHLDGRMAKIKLKDFGLVRGV